jgi:hypothetical protein
VPFVPGSNASATVTVLTHDATPVVPRDKIEDKNDEAKKEKHRQNDEAKKEKHRRHREQQMPVEAQRYQEDRGFGGFGWSNRQY